MPTSPFHDSIEVRHHTNPRTHYPASKACLTVARRAWIRCPPGVRFRMWALLYLMSAKSAAYASHCALYFCKAWQFVVAWRVLHSCEVPIKIRGTGNYLRVRRFLPQRLSSDQLAVRVRLDAQTARIQYATLPGTDATRWARDRGQLSIGQRLRHHSQMVGEETGANLSNFEHLRQVAVNQLGSVNRSLG